MEGVEIIALHFTPYYKVKKPKSLALWNCGCLQKKIFKFYSHTSWKIWRNSSIIFEWHMILLGTSIDWIFEKQEKLNYNHFHSIDNGITLQICIILDHTVVLMWMLIFFPDQKPSSSWVPKIIMTLFFKFTQKTVPQHELYHNASVSSCKHRDLHVCDPCRRKGLTLKMLFLVISISKFKHTTPALQMLNTASLAWI